MRTFSEIMKDNKILVYDNLGFILEKLLNSHIEEVQQLENRVVELEKQLNKQKEL